MLGPPSMKFVHTYMRTSTNAPAITLLSIVAFLSFSSAALATPPEKPKWSFQYTRAANVPSNCPTQEYLRNSLAANLDGQDPFEKGAPRSISVVIEQLANELEARVTIRDENGTVTNKSPLHTPSWRCDQLAERIVFSLQNIIDPLKLPQTETEATPNVPQPPKDAPAKNEPNLSNVPQTSRPNPPKNERGSVATTSPSRKPPKLGLSFAIGPAWWNAPKTALSTTIGIELFWKRAAIGIEGHYDYTWTVPESVDSTAERTTVTILACGLHRRSTRFLVRGCGFGDFGKTIFDNQKSHFETTYAPVVDVGARIAATVWPVQNIGVEVRADGAYAVARPEIRMLDNRVWRAAPFTGAVRIAFLGVFDVF